MAVDIVSIASTILNLRRIGKDTQFVEVKESVGRLPISTAETLSAFSNTSGGLIILGLSEKEGFTPAMRFRPAAIADALANMCSNMLTPPVRPKIEIIEFESAQIVVATVDEMVPRDKPCFVTERGLYRGSYTRSNDSDRRMTSYEIDCLMENRVQPRHDLILVDEALLDDLDERLVEGVLRRQRELHPRIFSQLPDEDALLRLRIVARGDDGSIHPTLAGLLALGSYPQQFFPRLTITFAAYSGETKGDGGKEKFLDSRKMAGSIPEILQESLDAVRRNMRIGGVLDGAFRKDVPDYPEGAVREAICNALMHRLYSPMAQGTQVQVNLYANRLEVMSPGGLYGTVTVDNLGEAGISSTRNQYLADILETTPYPGGGYVAENRGSGYQLIKTELAQAGMRDPVAIDTSTMFTLSFFRASSAKGDAIRGVGNGEAEDLIMRYLESKGEVGPAELAGATGLSRRTLRYRLDKLTEEGIVERIGVPRSPRQTYRLK